jgi:membrane protease YdiL (CAAX protease family)
MNRSAIANSTADIVIVTALCFGWFILGSIQAVAAGFPSHPFTDGAFYGIIASEVMLAAAAFGYLHVRGHDLAHFIPTPTVAGSVAGVGLFVAGSLAAWALTSMVGNNSSATQPIEHMVADATISFAPLVGLSLVNGLYEETFLVGYLQRALDASGASFAVGVSLLVRVLYHLYQGPVGAVSVLGFGAVLSLYYLRTKRLWPLVFAHILADLLGFALG